MTVEEVQLTEIRNQIDAIDAQIQSLIGQRAACAQKVADIKTQGGKVEAVFYRPEREAQVLRSVKERNDSLLPDEEMAKLFREIMSACLALEQPMSIAYLGPEGSYSHASVIKQFGVSAHPVAVSTIDQVFEAVESGEANYGMVPVENSSEGVVKSTQNALLKTSLQVSGEVDLPIHHCLLSRSQHVEGIRKVVAHQQALGQCEQWLKNNLPWVQLEAVDSNALASKMAQQDEQLAAIASEQAAMLYELHILDANIEDQKSNTTKFWVIGRDEVAPSGEDKTAMVLSIRNKSGALLDILESFATRGINMTRIISQPSTHKKWDYLFFIDVLGHKDEPALKDALSEVESKAAFFKLLGSFPISPL
ncbi:MULTISPECIES: prephenate dehydratase [Thiomicrorhabdus]|uniref:Bifunctional chorismate mutase/prephenate dehydratase n=1 Tax=Thiomicrorhabdus heinhorstiae TaxID=2748010 RepID=A0ABS0BST7_9GAMM|nr:MULTISPECIES: prephenate dehydratase [Thiomicrorhabdus]MBF6056910.1 prephenate dehydratase [Thiomicrorhabdus heinhorstiae]